MAYKYIEQKRELQRLKKAKRRSEWFEGKRCFKCGSSDNLELDHIDPVIKVSHRIWSWSEEKRENELSKCQCLCKECHNEKTQLFRALSVRHGTTTAYNHYGCRCMSCREVSNVRMRKRRNIVRKNKFSPRAKKETGNYVILPYEAEQLINK